jgi:hypothetical protein
LSKNFVVSIYESTKEHLLTKKSSRFSVKGEVVVDEDTRILYLVHARLLFILSLSINEDTETQVMSCMCAMQKLILDKIDIAEPFPKPLFKGENAEASAAARLVTAANNTNDTLECPFT